MWYFTSNRANEPNKRNDETKEANQELHNTPLHG